MRPSKTASALLLTACLLAVGAALPLLVGELQNRASAQPEFGQMQSVDLKLDEPLSLTDKLYIMGAGEYYRISQQTDLTQEQLPEVVETALEPYYARNLLPHNKKDATFRAEPYILYLPAEPELSCVVWDVDLEAMGWRMELALDDETGKLLSIQYFATEEQTVYTEDAYTEQFLEAWFEGLDLSDAPWKESRWTGKEGNNSVSRCSYTDSDRRFLLEFITYSRGFWLNIYG